LNKLKEGMQAFQDSIGPIRALLRRLRAEAGLDVTAFDE
jgi:hypothetical protein